MIRGYYTAASGLVTEEKKLNNIANNLANVNTVGFKRENLVLGTFGEHVTARMSNYYRKTTEPIGPGAYMQIVDEKYSDHSQGSFEMTTRPFDMAIQGEGYFIVTNEAGEEMLTRDGQFSLDEDGFLILPGFGRVQGTEGDIQIDLDEIGADNLSRADIVVDGRGQIFVYDEDGEMVEIAALAIAIPDDYDDVRKLENGLWTAGDYAVFNPEEAVEEGEDAFLFQVRQYYLEKSNVNLSDEMTNMISSQRSLQSSSQIVKMYDDLAGQINSLSRIQ